MGFFEIGSHKVFSGAGFELQSSWSLSPEKLGLQAWTTGARLPFYFSLAVYEGSSLHISHVADHLGFVFILHSPDD
jgi:hypothetical protein